MEPLFRTETKFTFDEFITFSNFMYYKMKKMGLKQGLVAAGMLVMALVGFLLHEDKLCWVFLIAAPLFLVTMQLRIKTARKKVWDSGKAMQDLVSYYAFYDDHVSQSNRLGKSDFPYADLFRTMESKTHIYMMVTQSQGMILRKDACSPELIAFLRDKCISGEKKDA